MWWKGPEAEQVELLDDRSVHEGLALYIAKYLFTDESLNECPPVQNMLRHFAQKFEAEQNDCLNIEASTTVLGLQIMDCY